MKVMLVTFFSLIILTSSVYAYQFEDYEWGMPKKLIEGKVALKSKYNTRNDKDDNGFTYQDKIFGRDCFVQFNFTETSHQLFDVRIDWCESFDFTELKKMFVSKYGEPNRSDKDSAYWSKPEEDEALTVSSGWGNNNATQIHYVSYKYKKLNEKEKIEAIMKEKDRF